VFVQRCINGECGKEFDLDERVYVCLRCGDLLDIERVGSDELDAESLRTLWRERLISNQTRDRSGVWRFREFLPFP
jgi:threonine synthase